VTMRLSSTVMEIWPFKVLLGKLPGTEVGRRSVGWSVLQYVKNVCFSHRISVFRTA